MYEQQREDQGNNLLGNVVIGAGLLGAGALGVNYARSVLKNRNRKTQSATSSDIPRSGQGGVQRMDLSALPEQTRAGVYQRAKEKYPDPGVGKDVQYRNPGSGGTDLSMLVTDPNTGEIYRRGGGQSVNQQQAAPKNQGGGINLSKQNLMSQGSLTTDQMMSFGQRQSRPDVDYVRNRIASGLEAPAGAISSSVQLRNLPPANRVNQLISEIGVDEMGRMTAGPEYAKEAAQQAATESSRQSRIVKQLEKQDPEFERIAKDIIAEMRGGGGQGSTTQPKPSGGGGINDEKAARIARNRQKEMARMNDYMSDVLESSISEIQFTNEQVPSSVLKLAERAGTGTASAQDVSTFRNWAQTQFKNDPTVLGEINEAVGSFFDQQPTKTTPSSSGPKLAGYSEGPVDAADKAAIQASRRDRPQTLVEVRESSRPFVRTAQNEAVQTANDQSDARFFKNLQRNEDVDLTIVNEDVLDKQKARAFDQLFSDAERYMKQKQMESEIDLKFDYSSEEARQAADVGAALERIRNNPTRVAAEKIIDELQAEGRAERDLARFQAEGPEGGELAGLKAEDNIRQRSEQQGSRSMTGEQLEEVLLGESKVIDSNMRGRALRGGKVNEEGNFFTAPGTVTYVGEGGAESGDFRDASTGIRTDIPVVASVAKTPEGAASILASEAIRKRYRDQGPQRLSGPAADVARSMEVMRQGMEAEPREILPSTQVPTINKAGYEYGDVTIAVPAETQFTGDAVDAAGPVLFTGKNKRDSAVVGTSPPLTQGGISFDPDVATYNERMAQGFLNRAIEGGLTQKQTPGYVYTPSQTTEPVVDVVVGPGGRRRQLEIFGNQPLDTPYLSTGKAAGGPEGVDASQRTGYARYTLTSKPVGTPSTGAMTVGINYAELPQSDTSYFNSRDIGRTPYAGPVQTYAERLAQSTGGTATPMSMLPDRGDGRTTRSIQPPAYDPRMKRPNFRLTEVVATPKAVIPVDAGPVRLSIPADPARQEAYKPASFEGSGQDVIYQRMYAPQVAAGNQAVVTYPHMRGQSLFPTGTLINDPDLRGGPVKFQGRERREDEYTRPISERLTRGDTMTRFPLTRRG